MIKKISLIILLISIPFICMACEKKDDYKITRINNDYKYIILSSKGKVLEENTISVEPRIKYLSKNIIEVSFGAGNVSQYQFYEINKELISQIYENPSAIYKDKIVYMSFEKELKLIIRNIFDKQFYKEIKRNFSPVAAPYNAILSAKFIDDNHLEIIYLEGSTYKEKKETINLLK